MSTNMTAAATKSAIATFPNSRLSGIELMNPAVVPAILLPSAFDRNQTPIIRPTIRAGASLVTALRPTGLRHSSPSTEMKYAVNSHNGLTRTPAALCAADPAGTRTRKATPTKSRLKANFAGTDGSRFPSAIHSQPKTGASTHTKIACAETNHDEGKVKPNIWRRV